MTIRLIRRLAHRPRVVLLAALMLVLSQSIAFAHSHEGDLQLRVDCQLCAKISSADEAVPVTVTLTASEWPDAAYVESEFPLVAVSVTSRSARAPPSLLDI